MILEELDFLLAKMLDFDAFQNIDTINGIQVANAASSTKKIERIAVAVDASIPVIRAAAACNANMILVHHGLFWGSNIAITQAMHTKIHMLMTDDIALYAIHLPLDAHMTLGNNAQLARKMGLIQCEPCAMHKTAHIGVRGLVPSARSVDDILRMLFAYPNSATKKQDASSHQARSCCMPYATSYDIESYSASEDEGYKMQTSPPRALSMALHGPRKVQKVAIVSGSGHSFLDEVHAHGVEMLITGDASHIAALRAYELNMHLVSAGHYFTEIWGVLALGAYLQKTQGAQVIFLDSPTEH